MAGDRGFSRAVLFEVRHEFLHVSGAGFPARAHIRGGGRYLGVGMRRSKQSGRSNLPQSKNVKLEKLEKKIAADSAIGRALKKYHCTASVETRAEMHRLVRKMVGYKEKGHDAAVFWQKVLKRKERFKIRTHRAAYVEALAEAMKVYEYVCSLPFLKFVEHVKALCAHSDADPCKKKFNLLRLVLMYVIDYDCRLGKDRQGVDTHDMSRDAKALTWLISKGIGADGLVAHYRKFGGGVDKWSRLASKNSSVSSSAPPTGKTSAASNVGATATARNASPQHGQPSHNTGAPMVKPKSAAEGLLDQIAAAYDLESGESLILHLRGTVKSGVVLLYSTKVKHVGPLGIRRVRAERLGRRIRKLTARDGVKRKRG